MVGHAGYVAIGGGRQHCTRTPALPPPRSAPDMSAGLRLGAAPSAGASTWPRGRRTLLVSKNLLVKRRAVAG